MWQCNVILLLATTLVYLCGRSIVLAADCDKTEEWTCNNGECISLETLCDGTVNCADSSDESSICQEIACPPFVFRCDYGACVSGNARCNGVLDCADGSDEGPQQCNIDKTPKQPTKRPKKPKQPNDRKETTSTTMKPLSSTTESDPTTTTMESLITTSTATMPTPTPTATPTPTPRTKSSATEATVSIIFTADDLPHIPIWRAQEHSDNEAPLSGKYPTQTQTIAEEQPSIANAFPKAALQPLYPIKDSSIKYFTTSTTPKTTTTTTTTTTTAATFPIIPKQEVLEPLPFPEYVPENRPHPPTGATAQVARKEFQPLPKYPSYAETPALKTPVAYPEYLEKQPPIIGGNPKTAMRPLYPTIISNTNYTTGGRTDTRSTTPRTTTSTTRFTSTTTSTTTTTTPRTTLSVIRKTEGFKPAPLPSYAPEYRPQSPNVQIPRSEFELHSRPTSSDKTAASEPSPLNPAPQLPTKWQGKDRPPTTQDAVVFPPPNSYEHNFRTYQNMVPITTTTTTTTTPAPTTTTTTATTRTTPQAPPQAKETTTESTCNHHHTLPPIVSIRYGPTRTQFDYAIIKAHPRTCPVPIHDPNLVTQIVVDYYPYTVGAGEVLPEGTWVIYQCQKGYSLRGSWKSRCTQQGWTGPQPVCKKKYCNHNWIKRDDYCTWQGQIVDCMNIEPGTVVHMAYYNYFIRWKCTDLFTWKRV